MPLLCTWQIIKQTIVFVIIPVQYSTPLFIFILGFVCCPIGFIHCAVITDPPPTPVFVFG